MIEDTLLLVRKISYELSIVLLNWYVRDCPIRLCFPAPSRLCVCLILKSKEYVDECCPTIDHNIGSCSEIVQM